MHKVEGGIAAATKFSGETAEARVVEKEGLLRSALLRDGLKAKGGCMFARYNDPGRTWSFLRVWIFLFLTPPASPRPQPPQPLSSL